MAEYVEFIGVPGVGKTTTYNYLKSIHKDVDKWFPTVLPSEGKNSLKIRFRTRVNKILKAGEVVAPKEKNLLNSFVTQNPLLLDLFWAAVYSDLKNVNGRDLRFHSVNYLSNIIEKVQSVSHHKVDKFAVVDEGLIHNISYFTRSNLATDYQEQVQYALSLIKLPKGVVFFDGDIDTVVNRTVNRTNVIPRDDNLSREVLIKTRMESIQKKHICLNCLKGINIPVLHLMCETSVHLKASRIKEFINGLS